jgi:hypothetical protein
MVHIVLNCLNDTDAVAFPGPDEVMESLSQLAAKYDHTYSVASRKVNRLKDAMCEAEEEVMAEPGRWQNWVIVADVYRVFFTS